jgi:monoamine oxidase
MTTSRPSRSPLTRRHFLGHLGAIGGSSLVMTALSSWDLMAAEAGKRPVLSGKPRNAKVLILGAGISGLTLGYELSKLGYDFQILEARDRVGGLSWTVRAGATHTEIGGETQQCKFDAGQYVNVGPWRIPYSHTGILGYCRELDVPLEVFVNEADGSYFYYEGASAGSLAKKKIRLREVKADIIGQVNELLVKAIDQHALDLPLSSDDQERLARFLVSQGYLDSKDRRYKAFENRGPGDPYKLSALLEGGFGSRVIRSVTAREGTGAAPMFQPIGGMDQIPKAFARAIGTDRITLNAAIQTVRQDERTATVVYKDTKTGQTRTLTADYVALCLPMSIIGSLDCQLSPELMAVVRATNHSNSAKVGLAMKRRFWEEDEQIFGGHLYSDLPIGEFSYPSTGYMSRKGVLLGLYANGPVGDLIDKPVADRIEHVLMHSSKVHPQIRQEFESAYAVWWKKVEYSRGGYAGGSQERRALLSKMENRLLIGSAATTQYSQPDWQEGAVSAGWQALTTIHERAMRA